jgi:hypothetical protein
MRSTLDNFDWYSTTQHHPTPTILLFYKDVFGVCYIQQPFDNNIGCAASYGRMALKL